MTSLTTILGLVIMAVGKTAGTDMMQPISAGLHRRSGLCHGVDFTGGACDIRSLYGEKI